MKVGNLKKMRFIYKARILSTGIVLFILYLILHPKRHGLRTYDYIEKDAIFESLHQETAVNFTSSAIADCEYHEVLFDDTTITNLEDEDLVEGHRVKLGGEFAPFECKPKFSTAIVVPYRDRVEQLRGFLVYMHTFLRHQRIHYRIFIVEQVDTRPFNQAKLFNIGAKIAMQAGYPCLVLHDIDLLPLRPANLYACTKCSRHMSASIDTFRIINGMSNEYYGWGGEDDDLYSRMEAKKLKVCRFEPGTSLYHMVTHHKQSRGPVRKTQLRFAHKRIDIDGLNMLTYTEVSTVLHPLFTHIMVDL